jgi:uncharacterized membrane protein YkoI
MLAAIAVAALLGAPGGARADDTCYATWTEAGPVVRKEGLTPASQLSELALGKVEGNLMKITLCEEAGSYVYKLVFFDADGKITNMTVDARNPSFPD